MDIEAWLGKLGLERYGAAFRANDIGPAVLSELTDQDLTVLGVSLGHRRLLLKAIKALDLGRADHFSGAKPAQPGPRAGAERRQLTVMFVDLVGSTALAAQLDPEDLGEVIRAYHRACTETVERWGGHIAKYMGDGVLAYFGWPHAHEDEAERAVRAGLDLTAAVVRVSAGDGAPLAARVGIATGLVMVGELIGEGAAKEETVVGETPNLAARLQALAPPGSVVISQTTRRLVGGLFALADLGPRRLKGFAEPLVAFRVEGEGRAEGRFEALRGERLTPLVGREHELGILIERWAWAKDGDGQIVLLAGEPGIGKSRLIRALRERLGDEPHVALSHFCSPHHINSALHPVIDLLGRAVRLDRDEPAEEQLAKLEAVLARSSDRLDQVVPLLATLLGVPTGERYPTLSLTPEMQKRRTLEALLDQLAGLAAQQPVLALYEDVHWIDPSTLELLGLMIERVQKLPVLVLITFRPEFQPPWTGHAHVTTLTMSRLGRRQGSDLVARVTGEKPLPAEVVEQIVARTDGVPLFVEELTKTVLESGLLTDAGDRYELSGPLPPLAIPTTLHDSLMARLDRLAPIKEVAQIGAVIGREFSHELLAAISPLSDTDLDSALKQLVHSELIFRRGVPPEATYTFKHALVQEAAYNSLLKSRRQDLHGRIAQALEEKFPDMVANGPEVLAHHLNHAELSEKAVGYWHAAAQQAAKRFAHKEAIAHLTKGLNLLKNLPETPERSGEEIRLQIALGISLTATKGPAPEVLAACLRARQLAERIGDTRQVYAAVWGHWYFNLLRMRFSTARDLSYELLELARREQDKELLLQAHHAAWPILLCRGELLLCREHAEQGLALYDRDEHRSHALRYGGHDPGACSQYHLAMALWLLGYPDQAVAMMRDSVRLARELAQPFSLVLTVSHASYLHQCRGEPRLAQQWAEETIALSIEQGFKHYRATGDLFLGWSKAAQGGLEAGAAAVEESLAALQTAGFNVRRSYYLALMAEICGWSGRLEAGQNAIAEAFAFADESGERWWEADLHRLKGELLLARSTENRAEAEACFHRALEAARQQSAHAFELRAAISLARLWADGGRRSEARDLLAPVYGWFTEGFDTADLKDARALLSALS